MTHADERATADPEPVIRTVTGDSTNPRLLGWARLWAIARPQTRPMLRSGAWYPVVDAPATADVVLQVRHRRVRLAAGLVEMRAEHPADFTVVWRSREEDNPAAGTKRDLGSHYAVCPASGHRVRLRGRPRAIECPGCGYRGEIAWHETG